MEKCFPQIPKRRKNGVLLKDIFYMPLKHYENTFLRLKRGLRTEFYCMCPAHVRIGEKFAIFRKKWC